MVQTAINRRSQLYLQVLEAGQIRDDKNVVSRLLSANGDLVAVEARYHRTEGCLARCIAERNIKSFMEQKQEKNRDNIFIAEALKEEYVSLIEDHLCVYELSTLKERYLEIASEKEISLNREISTAYFKRLLCQISPDLRFMSRAGMTDLVCSVKVTVDDALRKTVTLGHALSEVTEDAPEQVVDTSLSDSADKISIVHQAAIILRQKVLQTKKVKNEYFVPDEVTVEAQKNFLDPLLLRFNMWLPRKNKLDAAADIHDSDIDAKTMSVSCDITALVTSILTPKHLGLTVYLHHTFGSKKLNEDLNALGYITTYSEVRHFLTSAAVHMTSTQETTPSGGLVPATLKAKDGNKELILAAGDNWDHNEHTISGKRTTHAMTSILVSVKHTDQGSSQRILRVQERSIGSSTIPSTRHNFCYVSKENIIFSHSFD